MIAPRAVLIRIVPGFIAAKASAFSSPRVASVSGQCREIRSLSEKGLLDYKGNQADVRPFIKDSHCFVLPSYHEGMANTILECGAMGRPIITSDVPGCREGVIDGQSGLLCEAKNKEDLYDKVKKFMCLTHEEKRRMGKISHDHIKKEFDKKDVIENTLKRVLP